MTWRIDSKSSQLGSDTVETKSCFSSQCRRFLCATALEGSQQCHPPAHMQGEAILTTSLCQDSSRIWSEVSVRPFFFSCPVPISRTSCSLKPKRIIILCTHQAGIRLPTWSLPDGKSLFLCFPTMGDRPKAQTGCSCAAHPSHSLWAV